MRRYCNIDMKRGLKNAQKCAPIVKERNTLSATYFFQQLKTWIFSIQTVKECHLKVRLGMLGFYAALWNISIRVQQMKLYQFSSTRMSVGMAENGKSRTKCIAIAIEYLRRARKVFTSRSVTDSGKLHCTTMKFSARITAFFKRSSVSGRKPFSLKVKQIEVSK